jgi:hypothetical protein
LAALFIGLLEALKLLLIDSREMLRQDVCRGVSILSIPSQDFSFA